MFTIKCKVTLLVTPCILPYYSNYMHHNCAHKKAAILKLWFAPTVGFVLRIMNILHY
ncbi:hypothetical protein C0J52_17812 [Blattella germanica]|nr:hypothetical protein C0J52_17812 [Blattella germanica]